MATKVQEKISCKRNAMAATGFFEKRKKAQAKNQHEKWFIQAQDGSLRFFTNGLAQAVSNKIHQVDFILFTVQESSREKTLSLNTSVSESESPGKS